jgi:hypothetical protein
VPNGVVAGDFIVVPMMEAPQIVTNAAPATINFSYPTQNFVAIIAMMRTTSGGATNRATTVFNASVNGAAYEHTANGFLLEGYYTSRVFGENDTIVQDIYAIESAAMLPEYADKGKEYVVPPDFVLGGPNTVVGGSLEVSNGGTGSLDQVYVILRKS